MFKKLFVLTFVLFLTAFFASCSGDDKVTNDPTPNQDCGDLHSLTYGPFDYSLYTNTYVDNNNNRVFQFSAIPLSAIENICTLSKPSGRGTASWSRSDSLPQFTLKLVVNVHPGLTPYNTLGSTQVTGTSNSWEGIIPIGLQQPYGNGPGTIVDFRVEVSFPTLGSEASDRNLLASRGYTCVLYLDYSDYRAP